MRIAIDVEDLLIDLRSSLPRNVRCDHDNIPLYVLETMVMAIIKRRLGDVRENVLDPYHRLSTYLDKDFVEVLFLRIHLIVEDVLEDFNIPHGFKDITYSIEYCNGSKSGIKWLNVEYEIANTLNLTNLPGDMGW